MLEVGFSISLPEVLFKTTILMLQTIELFIIVFLQFLQIPFSWKLVKVLPGFHSLALNSEFLLLNLFLL